MYLTPSVLGPLDQAEYSVTHYEALRQREVAQTAARREVAPPTPNRSEVRKWVGTLIPALQR